MFAERVTDCFVELGGRLLAHSAIFGWVVVVFFSLAAIGVCFRLVCERLRKSPEGSEEKGSVSSTRLRERIASIFFFSGAALAVSAHLVKFKHSAYSFVLLACAGILVALYGTLVGPEKRSRRLKNWVVITILAAILCLGLVIRAGRLGEYPTAGLNDYAANTGNAAKEYMIKGAPAGFRLMRKGTLYNSRDCPFYVIPMSWLFKLNGVNATSLRLIDIPVAILTIIILFQLLRRTFGDWIALAASWFLMSSPWHIAYSRTGMFLGATILLAALLLYFLERALSRGTWFHFIGIAVLCPLCGYFYAPIRILVVAALGMIAWRLIRNREFRRGRVIKFVVLSFLFLTIMFAATGGLQGISERFAFQDGPLATDMGIWQRGPENRSPGYFAAIQTIARYFFKNMHEIFRLTFSGQWVMPRYQIALLFGMFIGVAWFRVEKIRFWWIISLCALLPALFVSPSYRRLLLLVPILAFWCALLVRTLFIEIKRSFPWKRIYVPAHAFIFIWMLSLPVVAANMYFSDWTEMIVRSDPFGGPHRNEFIDRVAEHINKRYVVMINMRHSVIVSEFILYDTTKSLDGPQYYRYIDVDEKRNDLEKLIMPVNEKIVFAWLGESFNLGLEKALRDKYPGGCMLEVRDVENREPKYFFYYPPKSESGT